MRIKDTAGRRFDPSLIGVVPTGRLLWVDQVHGNDHSAVRERMTLPFKTLGAAKGAALAGDTIMVLPGVYNESDLAKDGVNWHFLIGSQVDYSDSVDVALFDDKGAIVKFAVTGDGQFSHRGLGLLPYVVRTTRPESKVRLECRRVGVQEGPLSYGGLACTDGTQDVVVKEDVRLPPNYLAVSCGAGMVSLRVGGTITGDMDITGGAVRLSGRRLEAMFIACSAALYLTAEEALDVELVSEPGASVHAQVPRWTGIPIDPAVWVNGGTVRLMNSVILAAEDACVPGYAIQVATGARLILKDSHAIDHQHQYAITGTGETILLGSVCSNKDLNQTLTNLTEGQGWFLSDADVDF